MDSARQRRDPRLLPPPQAWAVAMKRPFLSDEPNIGPPPHSLDDLQCPRLRKWPLQPDALVWRRRLGGGLDGHTWKVRIDGEPFALKVFYDTKSPGMFHYYAPQRECQKFAVLQVMEHVLARSSPVQVIARPQTQSEALDNLFAFSTERLASNEPPLPSDSAAMASLTHMPRFRKCHGWLRLPGDLLADLPWKLQAPRQKVSKIDRYFSSDQEYLALVYEFVDEDPNCAAAVERVADFLWLTGFSHTMSPRAVNWKSSVLIDLPDIIYADGYQWHVDFYGPRTADLLLLE